MSWSKVGRCTVQRWVLWTLSEELTLTINCSCWRMMSRSGQCCCRKLCHFFFSFFFAVLSLIKSTFRLTSLSLTLPLFHVCAGTGCSGHGAEWVPPSEATSWTSFMTRTLPWTTSWVSTKRRRATTGAPPTSPNIPISSTPWRLTMDRYTHNTRKETSYSMFSVSDWI